MSIDDLIHFDDWDGVLAALDAMNYEQLSRLMSACVRALDDAEPENVGALQMTISEIYERTRT